MRTIRLYTILVCLTITVNGFSQNFKWLRGFGTRRCDDAVVASFARPGNQTVCFVSVLLASGGVKDTIVFDSVQYPLPALSSGDDSRSFVLRLDSNGHVLSSALLGSFYVGSVCTDEIGNYYGLLRNRFQYFKLDANFNIAWMKSDGNSGSRIDMLEYSEGHLHFLASGMGNMPVGDSTYSFPLTIQQRLFGEIDKSTGRIPWSGYLAKVYNPSYIIISGLTRLQGNIYMAAMNATSDSYILGTDTFSTVAVIKLDSMGRYKSMLQFKTGVRQINGIGNNGEDLFFTGTFTDTIPFGNKRIIPSFPAGSNKNELFVACIAPDLKPKWCFRPVVLNQTAAMGIFDQPKLVCRGNFIYATCNLGARSSFNGLIADVIGTGFNAHNVVVYKMDKIGNVLWLASTYSKGSVWSIDANSSSQVCINGGFLPDSLRMGPFKISNKSPSPFLTLDGFVTRISDNAILRGYVSGGPYCAGDSVYVPFTKVGDFDTANTFIAEISDANGNFDGGERELGRVKSNTDDTVIGRLPRTRFLSSAKYRIRIRSTEPSVQSYYKVDTLRLLVYSADKANLGRDTTLCKGDSLRLETFGGTRWTWSPNYKMKDSTARVTMVWPDKTTTYKLVIADSSGCGEPDTAYKIVAVRLAPKASFLTPADTTVCTGGKMRVIANFMQGDSAHYHWYWTSVTSGGVQNLEKSGSGKYADTLDYTLPPSEKDSVLLMVYLYDDCTSGAAIARYWLRVSKAKPLASFVSADTPGCPGKVLPVVANFSKGYAPGYNWQWFEQNKTGQWIPGSKRSGKASDTLMYTLPLNWLGKKSLRLVLKDNCSDLSDTSVFAIIPRDTLHLELIPGDTVFCLGSSLSWKASAKGGNKDQYRYTWIKAANGDTLSTSDSFSSVATGNEQVLVSLSDGCMPDAATYKLDIKVYPGLHAEVRDLFNRQLDTLSLCYGESFVFKASGSGGRTGSYAFRWWLEGNDLGAGDSLVFNTGSYLPDSGGSARLLLMLSDRCTIQPDSSVIQINSLPGIQSGIMAGDSTCFGRKAEFKVIAKGGKGNYTYTWLDETYKVLGQKDEMVYDHTDKTRQGILKRYAISGDGCSQPDTAEAFTVLLSPLQLRLKVLDTCPVAQTTVRALLSGGKALNRTIAWWLDNQLQGSGADTSHLVYVVNKPVICKAVLGDGCSNTSDTSLAQIGVRPDMTLLAEPASGCVPMATRIHLRTPYASAFKWVLYTGYNRDSVTVVNDTVASVLYPKVGPYEAQAIMTTAFGCRATGNLVSVTVYPAPRADFTFSPGNPTPDNPVVRFLNLSSGAVNYQWDIPGWGIDTARQLNKALRDTGRHTVLLIAISDKGCRDSMLRTVTVYPDFKVWIPTVFSPNGDNINDVFAVNGTGIRQAKISIFNRWGELIYYTEDNKPWDGTVSDKVVPDGVYMYKVDVQGINRTWKYLSGELTLLR